MARGRFITLEGGEGSGKSTQCRRLKAHLQSAGLEVVATREPGGSEGAEELRNLLVSGTVDRWDVVSEAMLHFVARRDHMLRFIEPALATGKWVISDRFTDSTIAYQGYGQGGDLKMLDAVRRIAIGDFEPDLTLLLDLAPEAGLARAARRDGDTSRYDQMGLAMHERLRAGFLALAAAEPERFVILDGTSDEDNVADRIQTIVQCRYLPGGSV